MAGVTSAAMQVVDAVPEILKREGVDTLFCYPVNPVIESAARADIRTVVVRQERIGIHMADAYARLHGGRKIGVFAMQHGPGAENAFGGIAQCYSESVPVLVLPAGYGRRQMFSDPQYSSFLNTERITKRNEVLLSGAHTSEVFRRGFCGAAQRPAPAGVRRDPRRRLRRGSRRPIDYRPSFAARYAPDPADVTRVAKLIRKAKSPVLYVGQGVHYAQAWAEVRQLAELLAIPVTTSLEGKSAFPENHPQYLGCGGRAIPKAVRTFLDDADLIIGVGCQLHPHRVRRAHAEGRDAHPARPSTPPTSTRTSRSKRRWSATPSCRCRRCSPSWAPKAASGAKRKALGEAIAAVERRRGWPSGCPG